MRTAFSQRPNSMKQQSDPDLYDRSRISCRLSLSSKKKCLQYLAELLETGLEEHEIDDSVDMDVLDALAAREKLGCTALGDGIAIPHGRVDFISKPLAAVITLAKPVEFDAPDDLPVDIIVALLIPVAQADEHLEILASLARFFSSAENRESMRQTDSTEEILEYLQANQLNPNKTNEGETNPDKANPDKTRADKTNKGKTDEDFSKEPGRDNASN